MAVDCASPKARNRALDKPTEPSSYVAFDVSPGARFSRRMREVRFSVMYFQEVGASTMHNARRDD